MSNTPSTSSTEPVAIDTATLRTPQMKRILASSFLGSAIEFYDFLLYVTAASLVFQHIFFDNLPPAVAVFASFGTLAAGYVARPIGGIIFGHYGDRLGRKGALVVSMVMMGLATVVIGLLPTYAQIGVAAPILLVVLRVLQGIAVGGEWGGAVLIALEHAPGGRRGFAASFANLGAPAGAAMATAALGLATLLPADQFQDWGWRIPFLLSAGLLAVGLFVRLKVVESPLFQTFEKEAEKRRLPIIDVFAKHWRVVVLGVLVAMSQLTISGMASAWAVNVAVTAGADSTGVLTSKTLAAVAMFVATIVGARLCDRYGRRPILAIGIIAAILFAFPFVFLAQGGTVLSFAVAVFVAQGLQGFILGPLASFLSELFPTAVRFTGASLCFQGASAIGTGFTPLVAAALMTAGGTILLGSVWVAVLVLCLIAVFIAREGRTLDLSDIH
ncbi:MFS transporter [Microbacterium barkeri]|nr:MFS transporter [Microbacterium barkeri]MDI6944266.1 MFS transporter [Microbacterium barkeri]MDR6875646.1 MFS family permease [Microbacterium barkeri]